MPGRRHYDDGESEAQDDEQVDWSQVDELAAEYDRIEAIEDDDERRRAAAELHERLAGG